MIKLLRSNGNPWQLGQIAATCTWVKLLETPPFFSLHLVDPTFILFYQQKRTWKRLCSNLMDTLYGCTYAHLLNTCRTLPTTLGN